MSTEYDQLLEAAKSGKISRREVLRRAAILGLALPSINLLLAACSAAATPTPAPATAAPATAAPATAAPATAAPATAAPATAAPATAAPATAAPATPAASAGAAGTLRFTRLQEFVVNAIWHPVGASHILHWMFSKLVQTGPDDMTVTPDLADSWDVSADGRVYTFHLHPGVKWQDGTPFTAKDVAFTINQASQMQPAYLSFPVLSWKAIQGFTEAADGKAKTVSGVEVIDDNTIRLTLPKANSEFLIGLADSQHSIMPEHLLKDATADTIDKIPFSTTSPIGTGPYRFVQYAPGQYVEWVANPDYFKGAPKIEKVFFLNVKPEVASVQLESGELDLVLVGSIFDADRLATVPTLKVEFPRPIAIHAMYLQAKKHKDPRIAQGIYHAIDRVAINESILGGHARVTRNPPGFTEYPDMEDYEFNPTLAKQLLTDAKFDFAAPFKIPYDQGQAVWGRVMPLVEGYLKAIGVNAVLEPSDSNAWLDKVLKTPEQLDMTIHTGGFEGLRPQISEVYYVCDGFFATSFGFDNTIMCDCTDLFLAAKEEVDPAKRDDIYHQIAKKLNDYPMRQIWWSVPEVVITNKRLQGVVLRAKTDSIMFGVENWSIQA